MHTHIYIYIYAGRQDMCTHMQEGRIWVRTCRKAGYGYAHVGRQDMGMCVHACM